MLADSPLAAVTASALWGLASILFSPCHLISVPLLVGHLSSRNTDGRPSRAVFLSLTFALGILVTIAVIGVATALAGRMIGDIGPVAEYIIGAFLILFGLYLIGLIRLPSISMAGAARIQGTGFFPVFLIGLLFGVGLGPCTFAFMAPVLALVLSTAAARPWFAAGLLAAFGVGHSAVIVAAGGLSQAVRRFLNWDNRSGAILWIRRVCGLLVAAGGVYLIVA